MIDFISTHPSADPQTVACSRLLAAVIAQAIEDASNKHCSAGDQATAVNWLFNENSIFNHYATLIGADAGAIRKALLEPHNAAAPKEIINKFPADKRRWLKVNYYQWLERYTAEQKVLKEMSA